MIIPELFRSADYSLFFLINKKLSFPWLNETMLLLREPYLWIPLYLFFLLFFLFNCRKHFLSLVLASGLTFAITDFTSASIIKPLAGRLRPCHNTHLPFTPNNIAGCGGKYSLPSSHASNHFGLAALWFSLINLLLKRKWYLLWVWAAVIGYAQVYVGVHYPADVAAGAALGIFAGKMMALLFQKRIIALADNEA